MPDAFRNPNGDSQFARQTVFTSTKVLAAERQLLTLAADQTGPTVQPDPGATGCYGTSSLPRVPASAEDQALAAVAMVTSGRVLDLLVGRPEPGRLPRWPGCGRCEKPSTAPAA